MFTISRRDTRTIILSYVRPRCCTHGSTGLCPEFRPAKLLFPRGNRSRHPPSQRTCHRQTRISRLRPGVNGHANLEIEMIKSPTIVTRRSMFHAGAGLAVAAMATPLVTPASAHAEDARQAGAEP